MNQNQIQEKAVSRYANNLLYLQNNHPELFKNLSLLDLAIDQGDYEARYALEYVSDGYFDILEIASGTYLYGENSEAFAQEVISDELAVTEVHKAIFFGVALGTHVAYLADQVAMPAVFWIVEDDLELFRLSLFVTDFAQMASDARLYFSVMEKRETMRSRFKHFFDEAAEWNGYIPYFTFYTGYASKVAMVEAWIEEEKVALS